MTAKKKEVIYQHFQIPLPSGAVVAVLVPFPMSNTDYTQLLDTLKLWQKALTARDRHITEESDDA